MSPVSSRLMRCGKIAQYYYLITDYTQLNSVRGCLKLSLPVGARMVLVVTFYVPKILKTHDLKLFDIFSVTQAMSDTDAILQACLFSANTG